VKLKLIMLTNSQTYPQTDDSVYHFHLSLADKNSAHHLPFSCRL